MAISRSPDLRGDFSHARCFGKDAYSLRDDLLANRCDAYFGTAFEDRHTEFILELLHCHRQGRLRDKTFFCGAAEMQLAGKDNDVAQVGKSHGTKLLSANFSLAPFKG